MIELSVHIEKPVAVVMERASRVLGPALAKSVLKAANFVGSEIARTVYETFSGRPEDLARSFLPAKFIALTKQTAGGAHAGMEIAAGALSSWVGARLLDQGGTVRPRTAKALAVPVKNAPLSTKRRWPRDWPRDTLKLIPRKGRPALLVEEVRTPKGHPKKTILHYVLLKSTTVRARHYLDKAAKRAAPKVAEVVGQEVVAAVKQGVRDA